MFRNFLLLLSILLVFAFGCGTKEKPKAEAGQGDEIEQISQQIKLDSTNSGLYSQRAKLYLSQIKLDKALVDVNRALLLDGKNVDAFLVLAEIYFMMEQPDNCNITLTKANEIEPENPIPLVKLAELNLLMKKFDLALSYTDKALAISTYNPNAYYVRGMIFLAKNDTLSAEKNIKLALDQNENFYEPMMQLGIIYTSKRNSLAEQYLKKAKATHHDGMQARYQLALYYQENGKVQEAILEYDTILMRAPQNKFALYNLGYVNLVFLSDYEKAITYFDQALISDPNYIEALYNKGRTFEEMGRYANAREIYKEVLKRSTNFSLAIDGLNRIDNRK